VIEVEELTQMQKAVRQVHIAPAVKRYIVELVRATRENADVYLGASPRGSLGLFKAGQAWAAILGRDYVLPDDIKAMADHVLAHRILVNPSARLRDITSSQIVQEILKTVTVPGGDMTKRAEPL
jgi:MoxR-like ATPase